MKNINLIFIAIILLIISAASIYPDRTANQEYMGRSTHVFLSISDLDKSPQNTFLQAWKAFKDQYTDKKLNNQDWSRWKKRYIHQIKTTEDAYLAIETMMESLNDPYTRFLKPYDFAEQNRSIDAELYGIGVHIAKIKDNITIIHVIDDTPAKEAAVKPGDIILKVDDKLTKGMDVKDVADRVRGKAGSEVNILFIRDKKQFVKTITREKIELKSVEYKILKGNYAYIKISSFISSETSVEMIRALEATKKASGIVIDLRGNQGGLLPNAIFIANMFIEKGTIVSIVDRDGNKKSIQAEPGIAITDKPVVILVNQASASASEILSGALKDHKKAIIVGDKTYGKGFVQKIFRLPDGSGINITIAKYLTPNGSDIDRKGIKPDYTVKLTADDFIHNRDPQLKKAEQILSQK